jgi:DNA primase
MPLSRFLIEAASDGCDLGTAEGRAHMASNARPLWSALPDGVLKRQLLGELAELAQLDAHDLLDLWSNRRPDTHRPRWRGAAHAHAAPPRPTPRGARQTAPGQGSGRLRRTTAAPNHQRARARAATGRAKATGNRNGKSADSPGRPSPACPRTCPCASRIDHAARLLLSHMAFLEHLARRPCRAVRPERAARPAVHAWLEGQFHEHGPLPWAVLRESLRNHPCEALA